MEKIFNSYMIGGFECSTHRTRRNRRLDVIAATRHDEFAEADYRRLLKFGMRTARDGVRWHLIETKPYRYDFSSLQNQARAARATGIQIIWDLFHYGYPDDLDIFSAEFPARFARFASATAEYLMRETDGNFCICPINEISFFAWVAGEVGGFYPFVRKRGNELKRQLVRATLLAVDAIRLVSPAARFVYIDPAIHVTTRQKTPAARRAAEFERQWQFQAFDMLCGTAEPDLGGNSAYLDILGLNYYAYNQWFFGSRRTILRGHELYRPPHEIFAEFRARYSRPIFIAETGIENEERADWFRHVCAEAEIAQTSGVALEGICLYPVVNHPGWEDDRHCHNGLWDYANENGAREIYQPLAKEISFWAEKLGNLEKV